MEYEVGKVFFCPGDHVKCKHFADSPGMYVVSKESRSIKKDGLSENLFIGIKCRWFNNNNDLREEIFSSKDLVKL